MTTSKMQQLGLDGEETPYPMVQFQALTERQRELLRFIRDRGEIRSWEAGVVVHAASERGCRGPGPSVWGRGCCTYAATDGGDSLKRLEARGLVEHVARGLWRACPGREEDWPSARRMSAAEEAEIVRLYGTGLDTTQIAEQLFWSSTTIKATLKRNGVRARRPMNRDKRLDPGAVLQTTDLYGAGFTCREVAAMLDITEGAVYYRLKHYARDGLRSGPEKYAVPRARRQAAENDEGRPSRDALGAA